MKLITVILSIAALGAVPAAAGAQTTGYPVVPDVPVTPSSVVTPTTPTTPPAPVTPSGEVTPVTPSGDVEPSGDVTPSGEVAPETSAPVDGANSTPAPATFAAAPAESGPSLAATGADLGIIALLGIVLIGTGFAIQRSGRAKGGRSGDAG
jgi:hypothetical protein